MPPKTERRQQHGEESRQRILDATMEIAAERGYEGTSISLVSKRSGLPASSIYWHFQDKDELLAAVMRRSWDRWRERRDHWHRPPRPPATPRSESLTAMMAGVARSLAAVPEFLQLGIMLTLERRPVDPKARRLFIDIRREMADFTTRELIALLADVPDDRRTELAQRLATFTVAASEGLFITYQVDPAGFDLHREFAFLAHILDSAWDGITANPAPPQP